jgi:hypothetical protein
MMLYKSNGKDFTKQVHPTLRRRIRLFLLLSAIMLALVISDIFNGTLSIQISLLAIVIGGIVGFITSRIFNLSWDKNGLHVVGTIDAIGWVVLIAYILFESVRATLFQTIIHTASSPTAITFAFIAAAFFTRVLGLRGRIIKILKDEKVFG